MFVYKRFVKYFYKLEQWSDISVFESLTWQVNEESYRQISGNRNCARLQEVMQADNEHLILAHLLDNKEMN